MHDVKSHLEATTAISLVILMLYPMIFLQCNFVFIFWKMTAQILIYHKTVLNNQNWVHLSLYLKFSFCLLLKSGRCFFVLHLVFKGSQNLFLGISMVAFIDSRFNFSFNDNFDFHPNSIKTN